MWEINNLFQLYGLLSSAVLGVVFCTAYDILRALRKEKQFSTAAIFFQDIIFSFLSAVICFYFLLGVTGGELRAFVLVGMAAGFTAARLTVSRLLIVIYIKIFKIAICAKALVCKLFRLILSPVFLFLPALRIKIKIFLQKFSNNAKKA